MSELEVSREHRINYTRYTRLLYTQSTSIALQAFQWLYEGRSQSLKDFLDKNKEKFKILKSYQVKKIKNGVKLKEMDMSMLYPLLQSVCGLAAPESADWHTKPTSGPEKLEYVLYQLKEHRNVLSHPKPHEFMEISETCLDQTVKTLQPLFTKALKLAAQKGKVKDEIFEGALHKMEDDIKRERYSTNLLSNQEFLRLSRNELCTHQADWPVSPYLMPRLRKEIHGEFTDENQAVNIKFKQSRIFLLDDLFNQLTLTEKQPKVIILDGPMGAGKTSLCRYLLNEWLEIGSSVNGLKRYELVLPLHCKDIYTRDLQHLLRSRILENTTALWDCKELATFLKSHRVMWLIDGWDEATAEAKGLITELAKDVEHHWIFHTMVIMTRPQMKEDLMNIVHDRNTTLRVSLLGLLKEEQARLLMNNLDPSEEYDLTFSESFISNLSSYNQNLMIDMENPLKFLLICRICLEDPNKRESISLTQLYEAIKDSNVKKLLQRLQNILSPNNNPALHVKRWLKAFCKTAFKMVLRNKGLELNYQTVKFLKEVSDPQVAKHCLSTFLEYCPTKEIYMFLHPSQLYFYASLYLCNTLCAASDSETELDRILQQRISKFEPDWAIDPCLGVYDILHQSWQTFKVSASRISNGTLWPHLIKHSISSNANHLVRKSFDLTIKSYSKEEIVIPDATAYLHVLLGLLELQSDKGNLEKLPIKSLMKLINLSILVHENSSKWLEVIRVSRYDEQVLQEALSYINPVEWNVDDPHLKAAWELLCRGLPEKLNITIKTDPKNLPDLEILLLVAEQYGITVKLFIVKSFDFGMDDLCDKYLDILCRKKSKCKLTLFGGHLSIQSLPTLSSALYLSELKIWITDSQVIRQIRQVVSKLKNLQAIRIVYELEHYPPLNTSEIFRKGLQVNLYLPNIQRIDIKSSVRFISSFCQNYTSLRFGLSSNRKIQKIHSGLTQQNVTVCDFQRFIQFPDQPQPLIVNIGFINVKSRSFIAKMNDQFRWYTSRNVI